MRWEFIDKKFKENKKIYLLQSTLATITIFLILLFLDVLTHTAIIATLGATAFVVFAMPHSYISKMRVLKGGYIIGIIVGCLCSYAANSHIIAINGNEKIAYIIFGGLAVGIAIFLMVVTNTEHPPAAGMALGLVLNKWDYKTIIFIFLALTVMVLVKRALKSKLIDLI
ncbi:MAG: HPP family protein [Candidatus Omnitrophota bacterium]|nr:MAG: HPP family protein [Candidatus Omnitrophota bacterium]